MVENKEVVVAILGASAGLAGLVLVFLGLVVTVIRGYQSGAGRPSAAVLRPYKIVGTEIGGAFLFGIVSVASCVGWLAGGQRTALRWSALGAFGVQLFLLMLAAAWALVVLIWKA